MKLLSKYENKCNRGNNIMKQCNVWFPTSKTGVDF